MKEVLFIGDCHFFHTRAIQMCSRPYSSVEEMNEKLIQNWNNKVKKEYQVFVVGDFAFAGKEQIIQIGQRLNGRKTLIWGNHESASIKTYYEAGFEFISKYPIIFENKILITHIPFFNTSIGDFKQIFAHLHGNFNKTLYPNYQKGFCVSVEEINYTPISYDEIIKKTGWFTEEKE